jgi:hypothetical protein
MPQPLEMARPTQTRLAALAAAVAAVLLAAAPQAADARALRQMDPHITALLDNVLLRPFVVKVSCRRRWARWPLVRVD